ncbi:MAG: pyruvate dehydrogenase complex dihydrolipoamide acetyltransferase [Acetobacteraceae bacterium]|nr:pyruvate dehydrogenase complex dihydrolipoamide acetyltransferase [Acetobacteraceae bacterium]
MSINILMPALSPTMTEGTLARWLKKEGDTIKAGDVIAEIETDKATMEVEAVDEGVLEKILVAGGTANVAVNAPIAVLNDGSGTAAAPAPAAPAAAPAVAKAEQVALNPQPLPPKGNGHAGGDRTFASPLARRMAKQAGIELAALKGSGPSGRIVKADIEAAMAGGAPAAKPAPAPAAAAPAPKPAAAPAPAPVTAAAFAGQKHTLVPHSTMRKVIARRLSESKQQVPHFYASIDCELDALLKLRADLNAKSPKEGAGAYKLSVNDLVIKAAAITLRRMPKVNAAWADDGAVMFEDVDISVAVSIPDGLITPIIKRADQKGLITISAEMKDLAARAKSGKLKLEEFQGGSFSISNMGMYGVSQFAAIINPPQAGILSVSAGQQRAVVKDGALAIATVMTVTLSVDHRIIDGALAAEWLGAFKRIVEDPLQMML